MTKIKLSKKLNKRLATYSTLGAAFLAKRFFMMFFFLTGFVFFGLSAELAAQQQNQERTPEEGATAVTERLSNLLNLSEGQQIEVYQLNMAYRTEMDAMKGQTMQESKAARQNAKQAYLEAFLKQLTPEQKQAWEELIAKSN